MIWLLDTGYQKFSSILKGLDMTRHLQYIYQMSMTSTFNIVGMVQSPISPCKTRLEVFSASALPSCLCLLPACPKGPLYPMTKQDLWGWPKLTYAKSQLHSVPMPCKALTSQGNEDPAGKNPENMSVVQSFAPRIHETINCSSCYHMMKRWKLLCITSITV